MGGAKKAAAASKGKATKGSQASTSKEAAKEKAEPCEKAQARGKGKGNQKFSKSSYQDDLALELAACGLRLKKIAADGNCFFRALSDQLQGDEGLHGQLRARIMEYIMDREEEFSPFVEDNESFGTYVARMKKEGIWAGNMELVAASHVLKANLTIYQAGQPRWTISNFDSGTAPMLHISYHDGQHYNSVRMADDPGGVGPPLPIVLRGDGVVKRPPAQSGAGGWGDKEVSRVATCTACSDLDLVRWALQEARGDPELAVEKVVERLANMDDTVGHEEDVSEALVGGASSGGVGGGGAGGGEACDGVGLGPSGSGAGSGGGTITGGEGIHGVGISGADMTHTALSEQVSGGLVEAGDAQGTNLVCGSLTTELGGTEEEQQGHSRRGPGADEGLPVGSAPSACAGGTAVPTGPHTGVSGVAAQGGGVQGGADVQGKSDVQGAPGTGTGTGSEAASGTGTAKAGADTGAGIGAGAGTAGAGAAGAELAGGEGEAGLEAAGAGAGSASGSGRKVIKGGAGVRVSKGSAAVSKVETAASKAPARNKVCPCGSKKKYKSCCGPAAAAAQRRAADGEGAAVAVASKGRKGGDEEGVGRAAAQLAAISI